jgi:hypothetical protein
MIVPSIRQPNKVSVLAAIARNSFFLSERCVLRMTIVAHFSPAFFQVSLSSRLLFLSILTEPA